MPETKNGRQQNRQEVNAGDEIRNCQAYFAYHKPFLKSCTRRRTLSHVSTELRSGGLFGPTRREDSSIQLWHWRERWAVRCQRLLAKNWGSATTSLTSLKAAERLGFAIPYIVRGLKIVNAAFISPTKIP